MIKWLPLLLLLLTAPAAAQPVTCATRPPGDSTNACASTQFVTQGFIATGGFTANNPLIGVLGGGVTQGTRQGSTTVFPTVDGTSTVGQCAVWDSNGGLSSTPCTAAGSGTVGAGLTGNVAIYNAPTGVAGLVNGAAGTLLSSGGVGNNPIWVPSPALSVTSFGAKCDASTDDTAAILAAFTATPSGGTITFPPGSQCEVSGSGANIFLISKPIVINCQYSLIDYTGTSNTTNLIRFQPVGAGDWWPFRVSSCMFNGHLHLADMIVFDTTNSNTTEITQCEVDRVWDLFGHGAGGGYTVYVENPTSNTNGGTYHCNFHDSIFQGVFFSNAGDSLLVQNNYLGGPTFGVWVNLIAGAGGLVIANNSDVAACPLLVDAAAGNTVIVNNEFEQEQTDICPHNAMVDLRGNVTLPQVTFTGNSVNVLAGHGNPYPLYLGNMAQSYIEANIFTSATALVPCIEVPTGAVTIIGAANVFNGCTTTAVNGAGGTIHTVTTHSSYP
jgi:hypothetical protein